MRVKKSLGKQQGSMLLEGMIAMLIFSFGVLAIVSLQTASLRQTSDAKYRSDASFLANQTIGEIWADRENLGAHVVANEDVASLPKGKRTVVVTGNAVTVTITWQMPGEGVHTFSTVTQING